MAATRKAVRKPSQTMLPKIESVSAPCNAATAAARGVSTSYPIQIAIPMPTARQSSFLPVVFKRNGIRAPELDAWNNLSITGCQTRSLIHVNR